MSETPVALFAMLQQRCAHAPEADAIASDAGRVSFAVYLDRVDRMMGLLCREGWTPDMVVGLSCLDAHLHLAAAMALLALGGAHVGLASHETAASNVSTARRLGVSLILCETRRDWMQGWRTLILNEPALAAAPRGLHHARAAPPESIAAYVKTSGSTDTPKLFGMSYARFARAGERCAADPLERRVMRTSTMDFDSTRLYRLHGLLGGCASVLPPADMAELGAQCERFDVSQVHVGTYALASLVHGGRRLSRMPPHASLLTGGSRVSGRLRAALKQRLTANLWISYATSEIGVISLAKPEEHDAYPEGVGRPRADAEVEIVDADDRPVARGEIGAIRARRPSTPASYVGHETASAQFRDGWFYPNDLVSWPEDGPLIYHGRADDVMMLAGVKISGGAIEDALMAHAGVREAVAFPLRSRLHGEVPAAAVVLATGGDPPDAERLLAHCRAALGIRAPRRVVVLDALPRTPTGKPLKRTLTEL